MSSEPRSGCAVRGLAHCVPQRWVSSIEKPEGRVRRLMRILREDATVGSRCMLNEMVLIWEQAQEAPEALRRARPLHPQLRTREAPPANV